MHLDPHGSEEQASSDLPDFGVEHLPDMHEPQTREAEERARPPREGLPKRFRMRHGRHYVDELLGEAPLRTVREIPISEIEPPPDEALDLEALEQSIERFGVIEPLQVARRGVEYRVIAGMRRLRAARTVGLKTVPCLVIDVDEEKLNGMREAASERFLVTVYVPSTTSEPSTSENVSAQSDDATAFGAIADASHAADDRLRAAVLAELAEVEQLRAKITSAAEDMLTRGTAIDRSLVSCASLMNDAISAVSTEARLRGVALDATIPDPAVTISLDPGRCRVALIGLLQCLLGLAPRPGATLVVRMQMTTIRPALLVECRLREAGEDQVLMSEEGMTRFFDAACPAHPCGDAGARVLAAVAATARAHGGRVQATPSSVLFVVPRPLSDL